MNQLISSVLAVSGTSFVPNEPHIPSGGPGDSSTPQEECNPFVSSVSDRLLGFALAVIIIGVPLVYLSSLIQVLPFLGR